jgi:hypothetical protein
MRLKAVICRNIAYVSTHALLTQQRSYGNSGPHDNQAPRHYVWVHRHWTTRVIGSRKTPWEQEPASVYSLGEHIGYLFRYLLTGFLSQRCHGPWNVAPSWFVVNEITQVFLNGVGSLQWVL